MSDAKRKYELMLTREEVPGFFEKLAAGMREGVMAVGDVALDLEDFSSFEVSLKAKGGEGVDGVKAKLKVKHEAPEHAVGCECETCAAGETMPRDAKPKYKTLKKRMKSDFKAIRQALQQGVMPAQALADAFIADSKVMCEYPGKGDEYYQAYLQDTAAFERAMAGGSVEAARQAVELLTQRMKECHDKYK